MLEQRLREIRQDHLADLVRNRAPGLDPERLARDLERVDLPLAQRLARGEGLYDARQGQGAPAAVHAADFSATPAGGAARAAGETLLAAGRVACVLVAGGQGSRLGVEAPKGTVAVSPVRHKSLFQLHAERILAVSRRYGAALPLFVMTSRANDDQTRSFFEQRAFFGLDPEQVHFFMQGELPSLTPAGGFILARDGGLFMNPDGHGGTLSALKKWGCLNKMRALGIEELFYFQVDNPLVKVCDPLFLGLHHQAGAQMSSKVVKKRSFEEKVGVIACVDGRTRVLEYSDMPDDVRYARGEGGGILHWAGSIAIHVIRRDFVEAITASGLSLPYHRAEKVIPTRDAEGRPSEITGVKFETFIFDALPMAATSITLEVLREEEFAPVKNRTGEDSLESSMAMQSAWHHAWLTRAGVKVRPGVALEISPLIALEEQDLGEHRDRLPRTIEQDWYLG